MRIFHTDSKTGELIGEGVAEVSPLEPEVRDENGAVIREAVYLIPAGAVTVAPPAAQPGKRRHWQGGRWEQLPEPVPEPVPVPVPQSAEEIRKMEVDGRLQRIDIEAARPLRAIVLELLAGKTPAQVSAVDRAKLATLETEAGALRVERAGLAAAVAEK